MKTIFKSTTAAAALVAGALSMGEPARADSWSIGFDSRGVIGFSYQTGGYCDRWGCPGEFWNYPVYYCPVFYDGFWFRGPVYYRIYYGQPFFWVHGGWHEDEWDGPRPGWACSDRFGPPLDYDYYEENGFAWRSEWIYDWWWANRDFYPGYDFNWWRFHHRDWDRGHDFDDWRERRGGGGDWYRRHGFDPNWQQHVNHDQGNWQHGWRPNPAWSKPNADVGNMRGFRPNQGNGPRGPNNERGGMLDHGDHGRPHDNFGPQGSGPSGDQHDWGQGRMRDRHERGPDNFGPGGEPGRGPNDNGPSGAGPNGSGPSGGDQRDWHGGRHARSWQEGPPGNPAGGNAGGGGPGPGPDERHMMDTHQGGGAPPPPPPEGGAQPQHEHGNGGGNGGGQGDSGNRGGGEHDHGDHHHGEGGGP